MQAMLIQQSPHCFDSFNKTRLHYTTLHNTLTIHSKLRRCLSFIRLRPSHNFLFLNNHTCWRFRDKIPFLPFLSAPDTKQTWRQCLRKSAVDIIYPKSGFGRKGGSGPSTRAVGRVVTHKHPEISTLSVGLRISSDPNRLGPDSFSLINPQQSV